MFKLVFAILAALVAFAAAKPWGVSYGAPLAYSYGSPLAYSAPVAYGAYGYSSPVVSAYTPYAAAPVAYAASPYSYYLKR
ncbi:sulfur globule protein CV1 [Cydia pomonella]|uniref:sulfur globule protein CV1 n=1 Tax=Cydia pomonella TaxID=82600 RepID=UPI002ADDAE53|nr:sulfur globule protein CV1 [Cydia pomonella]